MDWIDEKLMNIRRRIRNASMGQALAAYLLLAFLAAFLCAWITRDFCISRCSMIFHSYGITVEGKSVLENLYQDGTYKAVYLLPENERLRIGVLQIVNNVSPWFFMALGAVCSAVMFYRNRIKEPVEILKRSAEEMGRKNLDFQIGYDSSDEMGQLCRAFETMRQDIISDREELWNRIEGQKKINAAFAHDMRTPLTVLRGYSELLYRYIPEGKISEEKAVYTLKLMSRHLKRLEDYTRTMRQIRNFEDIIPQKTSLTLGQIRKHIREIAEALNVVGDISVRMQGKQAELEEDDAEKELLWLDESLFLEVLENLLSNGLRFARENVVIISEYESSSGFLFLYVHDDGKGFTQEEIKRADQPYFKGEGQTQGREKTGETSQKDEHFGLGLHICRVLAKKHGGTLSLANSIEGGAFVSVSFFCRKS